MFYCEKCRKKHKYPDTYHKSHGKCEFCGKVTDCNDMPAYALPDTYRISNKIMSQNEAKLMSRKVRRAEYCDSTKICNRVCVRANHEDGVLRKCKHFIAEEYNFTGMTFDATRLPVHKRMERRR